MKRFLIAVSLVAVLALGSGVAAGATQTTHIDATLTGVGCNSDFPCTDGGGETCLCFHEDWYFGGRGKISPPLGTVTFTGSFFEIFYASGLDEDVLNLTLAAPNGDQLVLRGDDSWLNTDPAPPLTWTVVQAQSTGRFAHYSGSGNYTLSHTNISGSSSEEFTVTLTGSLTFTSK